MASKTVTVPIPQSMIDEASAGETKKLRAKVDRLEKKLLELERTIATYKTQHQAILSLKDPLMDAMDAIDPYYWDGR